ncbi:hypothetical protein D9M69_671490 [compost metagenome]
MCAHDRLENCRPALLQYGQRRNLVHLHQARITNHVRDDDSGKTALDVFFGHLGICPKVAMTL